MNTIPITFNENIGRYNIFGGNKNEDDTENYFSVFILHRPGSIINDIVFENILSLHFKSVYAIFNNIQNLNIDALSEKFSTIKFVRTTSAVTTGELINICASECKSKFFIVLWSDTVISSQGFIAAMLDQLNKENNACIVPMLLNSRSESMQNQIVPLLTSDKKFATSILPTRKNKICTLFPLDFIAIYNLEIFLSITGFDHTIKNMYWQLLDFSLRAFLWGYSMSIATSFKIKYISDPPVYDSTIDESYKKFYLKNIAPQVKYVNKNPEAYISNTTFFAYRKNSGDSIFESWKQFRKAKSWVAVTKDKFKMSAADLIAGWEKVI